MTPFLKYVASDLSDKFDGDLKGITVVLPSKRAGLFFNRYLAELSDKPVWTPAYITMDELFHRLSKLELADEHLLIFHLYAAYTEAYRMQKNEPEAEPEPFDQFYSWGEVMLNDFDDIDKNLASAKDIFKNLEDLDDLTSLDYLTEEQRKSIEHYFGVLAENYDSRLKEQFLSVWNLLYPTYMLFSERLRKQNLAYEGMIRRDVAENVSANDCECSKKYVFVGFNVLTASELRLLTMLKGEGRALFYWDYDKAYMDDGYGASRFFEAGRNICADIEILGNEFPADHLCYDNLTGSKDIKYVSCTSDNAQARYAGNWIDKNIHADGFQHETAVVLCNENMLQSMLHSMPGSDSKLMINVTMGFPFSQTPVASLILTIMELHAYGERGSDKWNYTHVANVLKHPYTVRMTGGKSLDLLTQIKSNHLFFVSSGFLGEEPFLKAIFTPKADVTSLLYMISGVVCEIGTSYAGADPSSFDNQLYQESLFSAYTLLNRLTSIREIVAECDDFRSIRNADLSLDRYIRLVRQMIQGRAVPFHGEPAEGIQIMGLLETRCLDFKNVIVLGMNDENMPKSVRRPSFIPYTIREAYGLTTMEDRSSLFAYTFYRLLERAERAVLIYNNSVDGLSKGEMSRYMTQLLVAQDELFSGQQPIRQVAVEARVKPMAAGKIEVEKTPEVIKRLAGCFSGESSLSPTAINSYINCPLQFYLQKVAGLKADRDLTEEVGNDVFGDIFHYCMENIYGPRKGQLLTAGVLEDWSKDDLMISNLVDDGFRAKFFKTRDKRPLHYNGEQLLNRMVIIKYVKKQLAYDARLCPMIIEDVENKNHTMLVDVGGGIRVRLGGIIDRIDTIFVGDPMRERHRIVDYKTSISPMKFNRIDDLFDSTKDNRPYHILQTFYYSDVYTESSDRPLSPALMYIKPASLSQPSGKEDESIIEMGEARKKFAITDFATMVKAEFHEKLIWVIREMFSPDVPFVQCSNRKTCEHCDFRQFCNR